MTQPHRFHTLPDGRRLAFRLHQGTGPALVFLPGYMSDMSGSKASAIFEHAAAQGRTCLLLDYSGCGESSGDFAEGTLSRWRDEVLSLIDVYVPQPIVLIGSSMGGWLMLLVGAQLSDRLQGLIGIAAAPDFTRWGFADDQRSVLAAGEILYEDNPYGPEPTPTHPGFFADAESSLQLEGEIALTCPVRLLHGQRDEDVPWETSLRLADALVSRDVQVSLIKDGDHRLSRDQDIATLLAQVDALLQN
ncbi:MAG: alpha/beta hydrolase [Pseudomonadota bacterium]